MSHEARSGRNRTHRTDGGFRLLQLLSLLLLPPAVSFPPFVPVSARACPVLPTPPPSTEILSSPKAGDSEATPANDGSDERAQRKWIRATQRHVFDRCTD